MGSLTVKGDKSEMDEIKDLIVKTMQWKNSQSKEMNKVQVERAINVWNDTTLSIDKNKDKAEEIELYKLLFALRTSASVIQDTIQMLDEPTIYKPTVYDGTVFERVKPKRTIYCLGKIVWGKCIGVHVS
ncbi:uncharacterized protein LOC131948761 [Physella acuta]|uniref:uncharacterized protein LOC131948761 n=1 Tax=Physella acuta TaxID=109671 RepID=UPI0027DE0172|nr:uncharacterized protein LOC131948761 [Physella acuta]